MPMSGHVQSIRSTIEKKKTTKKQCNNIDIGGETNQIQVGLNNEPIQQQHTSHHRFVPNRDSPTWKSVQKQQQQQQQSLSTKKKQLTYNKNNEQQSPPPQQQQQLSPTLTVSSTAAVASTASSNSATDGIFATIVNSGKDEMEEVVVEEKEEEEEEEEDVDEEKYLTSLPSPPPTLSPSSTSCSSVNWEVLEKLLGGDGGSIDDDDDGNKYGSCGGHCDVIGGEYRGKDMDAKSKIRLLAELVGSKARTTTTTTSSLGQHDVGVEAKEDSIEHSQGKHHPFGIINDTKKKTTITKTKKRSSSEASTQTTQAEEPHRDSLLGSYVANRSDKTSSNTTTTSPKSMIMDIVEIETAPSSITTASPSSNKLLFQRQHEKGTNSNIVVDIATSFSSSSSYSSSSLVYSLGETIQSVEQQHHVQQQRGHPLRQHIVNHHTALAKNDAKGDVDVAFASPLDESMTQLPQQPNSIGNKDAITVTNDQVAEYLASTLAECRLLLEMSPPPTPMMTYQHHDSKQQHKMFPTMDDEKWYNSSIAAPAIAEEPTQLMSTTTKSLNSDHVLVPTIKSQPEQSQEEEANVNNDKEEESEAHHSSKEQEQKDKCIEENKELEDENQVVEVDEDIQEKTEEAVEDEEHPVTQHENEVIEDGTSHSKPFLRSPTSFIEFLICPTCSEEFTDDIDGGGTHQPLHSFACDHIICRGCVYTAFSTADDGDNANSLSTMVFCPECGHDGAFDIRRPIVSRAYLNLVRKVKSANTERSISSKDGVCSYSSNEVVETEHLASQPNKNQRQQQSHQIVGVVGKVVPNQICVPSPTSKKDRLNSHRSRGMEENRPEDKYSENHTRGATLNLSVIVPLHSNRLNDSADLTRGEMTTTSTSCHHTDHSQQLHPDPSTPISRAQLHVVQRREKLAQSLEKVNMILERSKALTVSVTPKEVDFLATSHDFPSNLNDDNDSNSKETFEWDKNVFHAVTSGVKSRRKSELRIDTGEENALLSSSWSSPPSFGQVDFEEMNAAEEDGNTSHTNELPVLMDHRLIAVPPEQSTQTPVTAEDCNDAMDIFRVFDIDQAIEFGSTNNLLSRSASTESSTTESKDETLALLPAGDEQGTKVLKSSKFKAYCFNNIKKNSSDVAAAASSTTTATALDDGSVFVGNDKEQERSCPQFLPSLNYSIMNESDEFAGLIEAETPRNNASTKTITILSNTSGTKGKGRIKKGKFGSGGGGSSGSSSAAPKSVQQLVSWSFDDESFQQLVDLQNQENSGSIHNREDIEYVGENQASANNPTYDFSMHSCSLSPSTHAYDDDENDDEYYDDGQQFQLNGRSLVTHKSRRLHTKILKTLRGGGAGSGVKKSRKTKRT